jgi:perosamine synthetase
VKIEALHCWPSWPRYGELEQVEVARVVSTNQIYADREVVEFEHAFSDYQESKYSVGVGNATQGLHLALAAAGIGQGDEVIVTPCSWISSASAVLMQNSIPIFVDIEGSTLGLNPELIERAITKNTKAIILVHLLGYPAQVEKIQEIAKSYGLILIEDGSHAPGATVNGRKVGTFGDLGVFSLHQRKAISTGDGGVICTNNEDLASKLRRLRSFGDEELSYNYRMTEFSAVLGKIGLKNLDLDNNQRIAAAHQLANLLSGKGWVKVRLTPENQRGVYHAIALEFDLPTTICSRILTTLLELKLPVRKLGGPLNRHPHFAKTMEPARGYPWLHSNYTGYMRDHSYHDLDLPNAYKFTDGRLIELYAHPGTEEKHLVELAGLLEHIVHQESN